MILLLDCHSPGMRPKGVAAKEIIPSGGDVVLGLFPAAVGLTNARH